MPREVLWLLAIAGSMLPPALRGDWLREWHAEFWHYFGGGHDRREMRAKALGVFPDAWVLLQQEYGIAKRLAMHRSAAPLQWCCLSC